MRTLFATITATALLSSSLVAEAALIYGAQAGTSVADCPSFCTNFNFDTTKGGEGFINSGTSSVSESRGSATASAQLTGGLNTPILKAKSDANPTFKGAFASAFGVQGYTYLGGGETLVLDIDLDGLVNDPEFDAFDTRASLEVVLYETDPFEFFSDRGTLDFEIGATPLTQPGTGSEASVFLQLDHTNTMSDSGQISIDVATNDEFYIWAFLRAESQSGSSATSANAFDTGTMTFLGNPNLVAASAVPVPAAVWLFGSGLLGLIGIARRKKAA
jgi:hypothetical protein